MTQAITAKNSTGPSATGKVLLQLAVVLATYVVAGKLGQATAHIRSGNIGPVWPAYGVALAAILICGYRMWPAVALGAFLVASLSPVPYITALGQASGATLGALTGAFLLRKLAGFRPSLSRLSDALSLVVLGGLASAMVSATIGLTFLYATNEQSYSGIRAAWLIYWLGDATGVLLVVPLALTISEMRTIRNRDRITEFFILLLLLTTVCLIVFGQPPSIQVKLDFLAFAVLPFIMWAAIRFGMGATALSITLVATVATINTATGSGPFASNTPFMNAVLLDVFFVVVSVSGLTLAAVIAERHEAEFRREQMLRQQAAVEERLRLATIVESSNDAIISENLEGVIESWNTSAEHMFGYTEAEAIGQSVDMLVPSGLEGEHKEILRKLSAGERITNFETVRLLKSGRGLDVSLTLSPIRDADAKIVGASNIIRDITERKQIEDMRSRMNRRLIEAQEEERSRIARELHDDIAQRLALLAVGLEQLRNDISRSDVALGSRMDAILMQESQITSDVQTLSHQLHSSKLEYLGIAAAAKAFCRELSQRQKVEIDFSNDELPGCASREVSLCLYRVLQEALHNAVKHSGVRHFDVRLWSEGEEVHLSVTDFGVGFDTRKGLMCGGLGLTSMQERVKMVDGQIDIESQPDRGTTIHARIPVKSDAEPVRAAG